MFKLADFLEGLYLYVEILPYRGKLLLERIAQEDPELYRQILEDKGADYYEKFKDAKPF